jgi:hypothetical protein
MLRTPSNNGGVQRTQRGDYMLSPVCQYNIVQGPCTLHLIPILQQYLLVLSLYMLTRRVNFQNEYYGVITSDIHHKMNLNILAL